MPTEFHIGIDDTDSESGGCTTYTAAVLCQELCKRGISPYDFPWLVRLNPNIPWKTRGNGALSIHLIIDEDQIQQVESLALEVTEETACMSAKKADPAVVFLKGQIPAILNEYSRSALHEVLSFSQARSVARKASVETHLLKGSRGLIGSLAAVGAGLDCSEHTFEIIAYRTKENLGSPRRVDRESIRLMDLRCRSGTFHNLDPASGRILVCPHGPDPVLLGIRGTTPTSVREAFSQVRINEPVERIMIFRTNQGTDAHLTRPRRIVDLARYQSAIVAGRVDTMPKVLRGGHVIFQLSDHVGRITCAAYAPTRSLAKVARELLPGDRVRVYGGIRGGVDGGLTMNLEKIEVLSLVDKIMHENPFCFVCGGRCESMGRGQGFRCKKCGLRDKKSTTINTVSQRSLQLATYTAGISARRHLTRPTQ